MPIQVRKPNRKHSLQKVLSEPGAFSTTMLAAVIDEYGTDAFQWDPVTILLELEDDFQIDIPRENYDRLMVGIQHLTSDDFWQSLPDFINMCNAFSGSIVDNDTFDIADAAEIAWGVTEASLLDPQDGDDSEVFSPEIVGYIGRMLQEQGLVEPPNMLRGIVPADQFNTIGEFSDDPIMFSAIHTAETGKSDDINQFVKNNLQQLMIQLHSLQLENGDTKEAIMKLLRENGK